MGRGKEYLSFHDSSLPKKKTSHFFFYQLKIFLLESSAQGFIEKQIIIFERSDNQKIYKYSNKNIGYILNIMYF